MLLIGPRNLLVVGISENSRFLVARRSRLLGMTGGAVFE